MTDISARIRLVADDQMQAHPAAEIFPMMSGADFDALVADIRDNGQREPIIIYDGQILDGRNRYRACEMLGIKLATEQWDRKGTPEAFVISMNLHRRHLNESQRAMIGGRLATLKKGDVATQNVDFVAKTRDQQIYRPPIIAAKAAQLLNVGIATVQHAKTVLNNGTSEEIASVDRGEASVSTIAKAIRRGQSPEKRKSKRAVPLGQRGNNPERIQRMQVNADIWQKLSDALMCLTSLPLPRDVAEIINANPTRRRIVDERLNRALQYLKGLEDVCQHSD